MRALILSRQRLNLEDLDRIGQIIVIAVVQEGLGLDLSGLRAPELLTLDRRDCGWIHRQVGLLSLPGHGSCRVEPAV